MTRRSPNWAKVATPAEMRDLIAATPTDDPSWFTYGDTTVDAEDLVTMLSPHVTADRRIAIDEVLDRRTDNVCVVLEGLVDYGNVSAVMRTAEGFGIQQIHTIDTAAKYKRSKRTTQGADKWLDRYRWESTPECLGALRADGYRIVVADVADTAVAPWEADLTDRCAIVFGNELEGLSDSARDLADVSVSIPMAGFTESFNISVATALVLSEVFAQRRAERGQTGDLSADSINRMRAVWYAKSVPNFRAVVEHKLRSQEL